MDIKDYIKDFLLHNDELVIPDFGGFVSEYEPATFDVNKNIFLPPTKKLCFKPEFRFEDSALSAYIEKKENIDIKEAKKKISEFVSQLKNYLKKGESVIIKDVGVLSQTVKGEILFEQDKNFNLSTESFGLKSIKIKPLPEKPTLKQEIVANTNKKSVKKPLIIFSSIAGICALLFLVWTFTEGFSNFRIFSTLFVTSTEINTQYEPLVTKSIEYLDSIAREDSIKASINKTIDITTGKKEALFYTDKETNKEPEKPKYSKFDIIAGSFQSRNKAEIFCKELVKKGFTTEIIESDNNLYRISIASFTSEGLALNELYRLRANSDIKQVWLLKSN